MEDLETPLGVYQSLHAQDVGNRIVLVRRLRNGRERLGVLTSRQLAPMLRSAWGLEDVSLSVASFQGYPLLHNFYGTNALFCVLAHDASRLKSVDDLVQEMQWSVQRENLPLPTVAIFDGQRLNLLWHVSEPFLFHELPDLIACQLALTELLKPLGAQPTTRNLSYALPLVGTINRTVGNAVRLERLWRKDPCDKERIRYALTDRVTGRELAELQGQFALYCDLRRLFDARWWENSQRPQLFEDWVLFFASSMANLCLPSVLERELIAIAASLEGLPPGQLPGRYTSLIAQIGATVNEGIIVIDGTAHSINYPGWVDLIAGKLQVTDAELSDLGLAHLAGERCVPSRRVGIKRFRYGFGPAQLPDYRLVLDERAA